jgi:hypothetical protein
MYHRINLDMLVMTDNPPEPTLEALTLFLMEQKQCLANVSITPMIAQCNAMPFTAKPQPTMQTPVDTPPANPTPADRDTVDTPEPVSPSPTPTPSPKRSAKPISKLVRMSEDSDRIARIVVERNHKYPRYYSHNDSWLSIRTNGRHYYYDSVHNKRGETNRPIRFRLGTGELETLYTAYYYIRSANKFALGTRDNRRSGYHIWLTRDEATQIRRHRNRK